MLTKIIKVGNSKGIRIPSTLLKDFDVNEEVELELKNNTIIIKPVKKVRSGWDQAFKEMNKNQDDKLLINDIFEDEMDDWEWS